MPDDQLLFLVVEDSQPVREEITARLQKQGAVTAVTNLKDALKALSTTQFDIGFFDLDLGDQRLGGLDALKRAVALGVYSVVLTNRDEESIAERAYALGAKGFYLKNQALSVINDVVAEFRTRRLVPLRQWLDAGFFTVHEPLIQRVDEVLSSCAPADSIMLLGPTGVGKTVLAARLAEATMGKGAPFININCAAIPADLAESELFGHKKGAFTGANADKLGKLALADNGTLFLDEIGDLPLGIQQKILKAVEEKSFMPVGSTTAVRSNFKVISATKHDLKQMVLDDSFRDDLFYRISDHVITFPSLAERPGDIEYQIKRFCELSTKMIILKPSATKVLLKYDWPGNSRELKKYMATLTRMPGGVFEGKDLPKFESPMSIAAEAVPEITIPEEHEKAIRDLGAKGYLDLYKTELIRTFFPKCGENQARLQRVLGVTRTWIDRHKPSDLKRYADVD